MQPSVNNFIFYTPKGLFCPAGNFYLDPKRVVETAVVSHAHGDHAVPNSGSIYCTAPTQSFMHRRHGNKLLSKFTTITFGTPFMMNDVRVTLFPAGHMLGSAQVLMEYKGKRYLYTGDFKLQHDGSCEPFEFVSCDHLITETTFASPEYIHPDPLTHITSLMQEERNIVIGAYAIGKAQRITRLLTDHCPELPVYIHPDLVPFHSIYSRYGFELGEWKLYRRMSFMASKRAAYILPPPVFMRYSRNREVLKVFATGWKKSYYHCDRVLPVSDHADWNDVLSLVEKCNPSGIYTVHGNGRFLKEHLGKSGREVTILN